MAIEHRAVVRRFARAAFRPEIIQTGVGKAAILRVVDRLGDRPAAERPSLVVLAGACGALAPVPDVPPIARIIDEHDNAWAGTVDHPLAVGFEPRGVSLAAVDRIVSTPADKHALHRATGAAIVDMESHAFAAACERLGLRYAVVRGVSDTPDETLPEETLRWIRPDGSTRTARAVRDLLRRPRLIPHMIAVLRRCNRVLPQVAERVHDLLAADADRSSADAASVPVRPLPIGADRVGVLVLFGGTFDPPTLAHLDLARDVEAYLSPPVGPRARVLFVPASVSPHKPDGPRAGNVHRAAMLARAAGPDRVWLDELDRAGSSYSIDTARRARAWLDQNGSASTRLRLLIGADQAAAFHRWREPRELIALAEPLVMLRARGLDSPESLLAALAETGAWTDAELAAWRGRVLLVRLRDGSSTQVRDVIAARGPDDPELDRLLHPAVRAIIRAERLYAANSSA
jgi:nicotinate (nicotinamide) nucleotide adenylyltransferase